MTTKGIDYELSPEEEARIAIFEEITELINEIQATRNRLEDVFEELLRKSNAK
jgi:hypothetical protein